jgi:hypothetical protein
MALFAHFPVRQFEAASIAMVKIKKTGQSGPVFESVAALTAL